MVLCPLPGLYSRYLQRATISSPTLLEDRAAAAPACMRSTEWIYFGPKNRSFHTLSQRANPRVHLRTMFHVPCIVRFYLETMKAELPGAWAWFSPGDFVVHNPYLGT